MPVVLLLVPPAWLLGTFPSAQLVARMHGCDILTEGSGNPGASNVARLMGWRAGLAVLIIDIAKGAIAAGVGLAIDGRPAAFVLALAAVLGHTFPLYRKGGKGVATAGGALIVLYPFIAAGVAIVWFLVARVLKKASLASLLSATLFAIAVPLSGHDVWEDVVVAALALFIIGRHTANIRRLIKREENSLDARNQ